MNTLEISHAASDSKKVRVHLWLPDTEPRAVLAIAHGLGEHGARYARLAQSLTAAGWAVYAPDHRGHGATAAEGELGWFAERDGFRRVVDDFHEIVLSAKAERPGLPVCVLGHSMGSIVAEYYLGLYGAADGIAACALSGVVESPAPGLLAIARLIAGLGCSLKGSRSLAPLLDSMSFGAFNKAFEPVRTKFDWLSRDEAEVDKYVADPTCGFVSTHGLFRDMLGAFETLYGKGKLLASVPAALPLIIMAGESDPCGTAHGFHRILEAKLRAVGLKDLQVKTYPGAHHEIFNETNRDEVTRDFMAWLESKLPRRA